MFIFFLFIQPPSDPTSYELDAMGQRGPTQLSLMQTCTDRSDLLEQVEQAFRPEENPGSLVMMARVQNQADLDHRECDAFRDVLICKKNVVKENVVVIVT